MRALLRLSVIGFAVTLALILAAIWCPSGWATVRLIWTAIVIGGASGVLLMAADE